MQQFFNEVNLYTLNWKEDILSGKGKKTGCYI